MRGRTRLIAAERLVLVILVLGGCGSSPEIQLDFPPLNAQLSAEALTVRGRFKAIDLNDIDISVTSSGGTLDASVDTINLSWGISDFQLLEGQQSVEVNAVASNTRGETSVTFELDTSLNTLRVTGIAGVAGEIYVSDARLQSVVRINRQTGTRSLVSGPSRGNGPKLQVPAYLQADDLNLLILDKVLGVILQVDTFTGDRTLISGSERGSGELLVRPRVFTVSGEEILVADPGLNAIVAVDRKTGNRELIFKEFFEDNPVILSPRGIAVDSMGVIYVADDQYRAVIRVDRQTGQYSVTTGGDVGEGPTIEIPRDLQMTTDQQLLLLDGGANVILEVDPLTGDRRQRGQGFEIPVALEVTNADWLVADNGEGVVWQLSELYLNPLALTRVGVGEGSSLTSPADVISVPGGWLVVDQSSGELIRIDAETSDRTLEADGFGVPVSLIKDPATEHIYVLDAQFNFSGVLVYEPQTASVRQLASPGVGTGPLLFQPRQLLLESNRLLILETLLARVVSLDINTGERDIFASDEVGTGESLSGVTRFALDKSRNLLYLLDSLRDRILKLELESGLRSEILSANSESAWQDLQYDPEADRLLILDRSSFRIYAFDLTRDVLSNLSGDGVGRGDLPDNAIAFHAMPQSRVAVVDAGLDALFVVDLESGDRVIVSR